MENKEMSTIHLEQLLLEFRTQAATPSPAVLDAYCRRYPQFARELTDYAVDWLIDDALEIDDSSSQKASTESSPLVSRALSRLHNRIGENNAARSPFEGLPPARKRSICRAMGIDLPLFAKFQNRLIEPNGVPLRFAERLALELGVARQALLQYLSLPSRVSVAADFKADKKPTADAKKQGFDEAVRASSLDSNQQRALLEG